MARSLRSAGDAAFRGDFTLAHRHGPLVDDRPVVDLGVDQVDRAARDLDPVLEGLGLDVSEIPHVDASSVQLNFAGRGLKVTVPDRHTLRIIRRDEFDAWLARKGSAKIREIEYVWKA